MTSNKRRLTSSAINEDQAITCQFLTAYVLLYRRIQRNVASSLVVTSAASIEVCTDLTSPRVPTCPISCKYRASLITGRYWRNTDEYRARYENPLSCTRNAPIATVTSLRSEPEVSARISEDRSSTSRGNFVEQWH